MWKEEKKEEIWTERILLPKVKAFSMLADFSLSKSKGIFNVSLSLQDSNLWEGIPHARVQTLNFVQPV